MSVSSSRDDLSRIALGSIDDWQRIQQDVASNVEEILAATLAEREPLSEEDKAMVSKLLETWQTESFDMAKANIAVNGQDLENYVPEPEETEPFDELLVRRRQASTEEQLVWDKTLADRRRKAPREVERVVQDLLVRQSMAIPQPAPVDPIAPPKAPEIPRWEQAVEAHKNTTAVVSSLTKELPRIAQKVQKAKKVDQTIASLPNQ